MAGLTSKECAHTVQDTSHRNLQSYSDWPQTSVWKGVASRHGLAQHRLTKKVSRGRRQPRPKPKWRRPTSSVCGVWMVSQIGVEKFELVIFNRWRFAVSYVNFAHDGSSTKQFLFFYFNEWIVSLFLLWANQQLCLHSVFSFFLWFTQSGLFLSILVLFTSQWYTLKHHLFGR